MNAFTPPPSLFSVLPRVLFVLGKGGVGRTTVAAAVGQALAQHGERVLVLEWTAAEAVAPWFGLPPAGTQPVRVAPNLWAVNYRLGEALRAYFVDHLHLRAFYRRVVDGPHVRRLIEAAPGIAELLFLGQIWWLTTLAAQEAGLEFDRLVVDAPATGHGASLLELPDAVRTVGASGLLGMEIGRVTAMMADPKWIGTVVVSLAEELAVEETLELVPRVTRSMGRQPLAAVVNRSVAGVVDVDNNPWAPDLFARLTPPARQGLHTLVQSLQARVQLEQHLSTALQGTTVHGMLQLPEQLGRLADPQPANVVAALVPVVRAAWQVPV